MLVGRQRLEALGRGARARLALRARARRRVVREEQDLGLRAREGGKTTTATVLIIAARFARRRTPQTARKKRPRAWLNMSPLALAIMVGLGGAVDGSMVDVM